MDTTVEEDLNKSLKTILQAKILLNFIYINKN